MATRCKACSVRTSASGGFCQRCKSLRHHGYKQIKDEHLLLDQAGGSWWIWNQRGDVLVAGKPAAADAVIALALGSEEAEEAAEDTSEGASEDIASTARMKTGLQLDREIAEALASPLNAGRGHATKKDASEISADLGDLAAAIRKERERGHLGPNRVHLDLGSRSSLTRYSIDPRSAGILMRSEKHRETLRQLLDAASIRYTPSEYLPASGGMHSRGFVKQYTSPARRDPSSIVVLWDGS